MLDVWVFGEVWCRGWLVTDVWISTASILNLCAISIDRYVAVTRPVKYRSIMTKRRAKCIVAIVWILAFIICLPPLLTEWSPSKSFASSAVVVDKSTQTLDPMPSQITSPFYGETHGGDNVNATHTANEDGSASEFEREEVRLSRRFRHTNGGEFGPRLPVRRSLRSAVAALARPRAESVYVAARRDRLGFPAD